MNTGLDNLTQDERKALHRNHQAGVDTVVKILSHSNVSTGINQEVTVSGAFVSTANFSPAVHYLTLASDGDMFFLWDGESDSDSSTKLDSGNTSMFLFAGERLNLALTGGATVTDGITRIDFRTVAGTSTVRVTGFTKSTSPF